MLDTIAGYDNWKTSYPAEWDLDIEGDELEAAADLSDSELLAGKGAGFWQEVQPNAIALNLAGFLSDDELTREELLASCDAVFSPTYSYLLAA